MRFVLLFLLCFPLFGNEPAKVAVEPKEEVIILKPENTYTFRGTVTSASVSAAQVAILKMDARLPAGTPIYLVLDTPGGSVMAGLEFINSINSLNREVKTVTLFAASMGFIFAQHFGERLISKTGTLMSHRASGGVRGQFDGELESRLKYYSQVINGMAEVSAKRLGLPLDEYKTKIVNELWLYGKNAVKFNAADKVVTIKCSPELIKKKFEAMETMFIFTKKVTFSACPLISGDISGVNKSTEDEEDDYGHKFKKYNRGDITW